MSFTTLENVLILSINNLIEVYQILIKLLVSIVYTNIEI